MVAYWGKEMREGGYTHTHTHNGVHVGDKGYCERLWCKIAVGHNVLAWNVMCKLKGEK